MSKEDLCRHGTAVVGFARTGKATLDFLLGKIKEVFLFTDTPIQGVDIPAKELYEKKGVTFLVGEDQFSRLDKVKRIVLSPGVDGQTPRFCRLRENGIKIICP